MPTGVRPRRIVPPLLLSTCLSLGVFVLYIQAGRFTRNPFVLSAPVIALVYSGYYLGRYAFRIPSMMRHVREGGDVWPVEPLFPGRRERVNHDLYPTIIFILHLVMARHILEKSVGELSWQEDAADIILFGVWWTDLAVSVTILLQALRVIKAEDTVVQPPPPTRLRVHPVTVLTLDILLLVIMAWELHSGTGAQAQATLRSILRPFAVIGLHHAYLLLHILRSSRARQAAPWPATPIIAGRWNCVLYSAGVAILSASLASLTFVLIQHEGWAFWRFGTFGRVFWACYFALLVVPGVAWFAGTKMYRAEAAATCLREGHQWRCSRTGCPLRADDGKQSHVASLDVEKKGEDEAALEVKTAP